MKTKSKRKKPDAFPFEKKLKGCVAVDKDRSMYFYPTSKKHVQKGDEAYSGECDYFLNLGKVKKSVMTYDDGVVTATLSVTVADIPHKLVEEKTKPEKKKRGRPAKVLAEAILNVTPVKTRAKRKTTPKAKKEVKRVLRRR